MTTFACITSVNQQYYDHCGRACIESFQAYWPRDVELYVYNEDMVKPQKGKRVRYIPWKHLKDFPTFASRTENSHVIKFANPHDFKKSRNPSHTQLLIDAIKTIFGISPTIIER